MTPPAVSAVEPAMAAPPEAAAWAGRRFRRAFVVPGGAIGGRACAGGRPHPFT
ncbi:hypothetical protein L0Z12_22710 [Burkholderia multivorans]|uniref:hypothetical protein n=1 Tax=Burkholderia multivorans TaxID=87883 RepID=UPI002018AE6C|nr:hypothetical protein [Burkholderia multivorans]UQO79236.1 hypothetical protein L0Z12_22710 [Burkholderia multivorans]